MQDCVIFTRDPCRGCEACPCPSLPDPACPTEVGTGVVRSSGAGLAGFVPDLLKVAALLYLSDFLRQRPWFWARCWERGSYGLLVMFETSKALFKGSSNSLAGLLTREALVFELANAGVGWPGNR